MMPPIPFYERIDVAASERPGREAPVPAGLLPAILDSIAALVLVFHPSGTIARANRACELFTGASAKQILGRRLRDLLPPGEELLRFERQVAAVAATGAPAECETAWPTTRTRVRRVAWTISALTDPAGDVTYLVATGADVTERLRLQRTVLEIADREQSRIGRDLHDGLGQHLTGIAFMSKVLEGKLLGRGLAEARDADRIVSLVNEAIERTRELARGLLPTKAGCGDLAPALRRIARDAQALFGISCWTATGVPIDLSETTVTHLCYIAREAVNNAVRHGRARHIRIEVAQDAEGGRLTIRDDGDGCPEVPSADGLGLNLMRYRASLIGGSLEIGRGRPSGTVITCRFPLRDEPSQEAGA